MPFVSHVRLHDAMTQSLDVADVGSGICQAEPLGSRSQGSCLCFGRGEAWTNYGTGECQGRFRLPIPEGRWTEFGYSAAYCMSKPEGSRSLKVRLVAYVTRGNTVDVMPRPGPSGANILLINIDQ